MDRRPNVEGGWLSSNCDGRHGLKGDRKTDQAVEAQKAVLTMTKAKAGARKKPSTGLQPERVKLGGDWKLNVKTALAKKRPKDGWPKE